MEINLLFFLSVVPAIVLYGIAKSGLGGSISLISVPLMTLVMPLSQALAIILPILIFSDIVAVYRFRKDFDLSTLKLIVPFAGIGIFVGSFTFSYLSEDILKFIVGVMGFLFTIHYFFLKKIKKKNQKKIFLKVVYVQLSQGSQVFVCMQEGHQQVSIYYP
jgi:uncharacterized membrane protein YfcA